MRTAWMAIGFAALLAMLPAARAQDAAVGAAEGAAADAPLTPDESATLARALTFDPNVLGEAKPLRMPGLSGATGLAANRTDNADGSSMLTVKQTLPLDSAALNVGVDLAAPAAAQAGQPWPGLPADDAGSAWASLGMADLASLDLRADPAHEQGRFGGTFKHSIPLGKDFSVTLADSYAVTQTLTASAAPVVSAAPIPSTAPIASTAPQSQVWDSAKTLKFDVSPTGTSFSAGVTTASNDPVTHNTLSADQKIYGPLHVTTAVNDLGEPTESKSITAGLKLNW